VTLPIKSIIILAIIRKCIIVTQSVVLSHIDRFFTYSLKQRIENDTTI
jgi:hypothetical protein